MSFTVAWRFGDNARAHNHHDVDRLFMMVKSGQHIILGTLAIGAVVLAVMWWRKRQARRRMEAQ